MTWRLGYSGALWTAALAIISASPALAACKLAVMADLPVTMTGLRASVPVKVNGKDTSFWLDSGAFFSIMSKAKAIELGLTIQPAPPGLYIIGIGGQASVEVVTIKSFGIVGQDIKNVQFLVGGSDAGNGLIGRNLLGLADTEFDLANGAVKIIRPSNCEKGGLAYWAAGKPYFTVPLITGSNPYDHIFRLPIMINGVKIEAELDSGAPTSLLTRRAAERAGIDFTATGVTPSDGVTGFGRRREKGWVVPVASVGIGDEEILRTRLEVIDNSIGGPDGPDMLLGADFMMAHHIYVARGQRRIYFTYSGGKPFLTGQAAPEGVSAHPTDLPAGKVRVEAVNGVPDPKTAEEFARRGNARLAAGKADAALADLNEAVRLSPDKAAYYGARSRAHEAVGNASLAAADIDKALALEPGNGELLIVRAVERLHRKDKAGALADTEAAAKVVPQSSLLSLGIADLFQHLGQPARAIPLFDAVIDAHPADSQLAAMLNGRCWQRALANVDLDKALGDCNRAIRRGGINPGFLDSRALVYFRKGDFKASLADYDAALAINPRIAWSLHMRGLVRLASGQAEAGRADQAAAVAIQPDIAEEAATFGIGRTSP
ncbi:aspartyl protease family protein [Sphingobium sp. AN558]|uniref:aspartyl protease family protein n=1 Tax=Sphingobium sp. AN558 TaxID=3133442 RepID=UPI0030C19767